MRCQLPNDRHESVDRVQYQLKKSLSLAFCAGKKNYFIEGDIFLRVVSIFPGDNSKDGAVIVQRETIESGKGLDLLFLKRAC